MTALCNRRTTCPLVVPFLPIRTRQGYEGLLGDHTEMKPDGCYGRAMGSRSATASKSMAAYSRSLVSRW
jgi:hypothetical protein